MEFCPPKRYTEVQTPGPVNVNSFGSRVLADGQVQMRSSGGKSPKAERDKEGFPCGFQG